MDLSGKTVLITGASQGIGRFLAGYFAPKAARLVLTGRNEENLRETAAQVRATGSVCIAQTSDLCRPETLDRLIDTVRAEAGRIDVLINNAADVTSKPLLATSMAEIDHLVRTNVIGPLHLIRLVAPMMLEGGEGMIVNISSLAGYKPNPTQTVYSISKTAVNGLSEALRAELRGTGIKVINVALSSIALDEPAPRGRVPVATFAARLERAMATGVPELYLSTRTKWLMRLYGLFPFLMRLR